MQCAVEAARGGAAVTLIEKEGDTGGKLRNWHKLFPTFTPADEVLSALRHRLAREENITVKTDCEVTAVTPRKVATASGEELACDAVVLATGFALFDARVKEEYGYGIYDNVITSADLERMFNDGAVKLKSGGAPRRIAILHCVGSRDEKVCQRHCSKVCCVTGVKQAIELKKLFPSADVFNFYMDIRMFGPGYEEMYRRAQLDYHINFVRGRISEASQTIDGRVQIKAEDTLVGRPLKMTVDMLVLIVGMKGGASNGSFARSGGLQVAGNGFMQPLDPFAGNVLSQRDDVFYAGTVTAPKNIGESLNEGVAVAERVAGYLKL